LLGYGIVCIFRDNTCNNNCCLGKVTITREMHIKKLLHSFSQKENFFIIISTFLISCVHATITNYHQQPPLVHVIFISFYWQCVSIALQCAQAIAIFQHVIALGKHSSSLLHMTINAILLLAKLWQTISYFINILWFMIVMFFRDTCYHAFICLSCGWVPILNFFVYKVFSFRKHLVSI
jgi:hypothetical protein